MPRAEDNKRKFIMKFIVLIVSATLCIAKVHSSFTATIANEEVCVIEEELVGVGTVYKSQVEIAVASNSGKVDALTRLPGCENRYIGQTPGNPARTFSARVNGGTVYSIASSTDNGIVSAQFIGTAATPTPSATYPIPDPESIDGTLAFGTDGTYNYLFYSDLVNNVLYARTDGSNSNTFHAMILPNLPVNYRILWISGGSVQINPPTRAYIFVAVSSPSMGIQVYEFRATAASSTSQVTLTGGTHPANFASVTKLEAMFLATDTNGCFVLGNGAIYAGIPGFAQVSPPPITMISTGNRVLAMTLAHDFPGVTATYFGSLISKAYIVLSLEEQNDDIFAVVRAVVPNPTTFTMTVASTKAVKILARASETKNLRITSLQKGASSVAGPNFYAYGHITVIHNADSLICYAENRRRARLYCKCMKKCCKAAENGEPYCPRLCELKESRDERSGDYLHDAGFGNEGFIDGNFAEFDKKYLEDAHLGAEDGFGLDHHPRSSHCGCGGCKKCEEDKDRSKCQCCCKRYLGSKCPKTILENLYYHVANPM